MKKVCSKKEKKHRKSCRIRVNRIDSQVARYLLEEGTVFYCNTFAEHKEIQTEVLDQIRIRFGCEKPNVAFYKKKLYKDESGQSFYFIQVSLPNPNSGYHRMRIKFREKVKINTRVR